MMTDLERLVYEPNRLEAWLRPHHHGFDIEAHFGGVSRHNLAVSTIALDLDGGGRALVAYVVGGARGGVRATVVLAERGDERIYGLHLGGFRLPVPRVPEIAGLYSLASKLRETSILLRMDDVPGFQTDGHHRDGWYTRSVIARRLSMWSGSPWAPARAYALREGVYLHFTEGYRLVPHRDFWFWEKRYAGANLERQGDLWVWPRGAGALSELRLERSAHARERLDRHVLVEGRGVGAALYSGDQSPLHYEVIVVAAPFRIEHPEHEPLSIRDGGEYVLMIAPGTSRPFRDGARD